MSNSNELNSDPNSKKKIRVEKPWAKMFPEAIVKKAGEQATQNKLRNVYESWNGIQAEYYPDFRELQADGAKIKPDIRRPCGYTHNYRVSDYTENALGMYSAYGTGALYYKVSINGWPKRPEDEWNPGMLRCSCKNAQNGALCIHEAALLACWEKKKGGAFIAEEDDQSFRKRVESIGKREKAAMLSNAKQKYGTKQVPALDFFRDRKEHRGLYLYDVRKSLEDDHRVTDGYSMHMAEELLKQKSRHQFQFEEFSSRDGEKTLSGEMMVTDSVTGNRFLAAEAELTGSTLYILGAEGYMDEDKKLGYWWNTQDEFEDEGAFLNINALALLKRLWDEADRRMAQIDDLTDDRADRFFQSLEKANETRIEKAELPEEPRKKNVALYPRIIMENGVAQLSFRIEEAGSKVMVVKNLNELVGCYTDKTTYVLSKTTSIDFAKSDFTQDSAALYQFIQRRIGEVHDANAKMEVRNSNRTFNTLTVTSALDLKGALLDGFYDTWDGHTAEYTDKTNSIKQVQIKVGHRDLRFALTAKKIEDTRGTFAGVAVEGLLPVLISGSGKNRYVLNSTGLSRVTPQEVEHLAPFRSIADASGYFRFQVGRKHLQEFYYRVVPAFVDSPVVQFRDECAEEAEQYLPPEPQFDFWLDCVEMTPEKLAAYADEVQAAAGDAMKRDKKKRFLLTIRSEVSYEDRPAKAVLAMADNGGADGASGAAAKDAELPDTGAAAGAAPQTAGRTQERQRKAPASRVRRYTLGDVFAKGGAYHDREQEERVEKAVRKLAPTYIFSLQSYAAFLSDDDLFDFLKSGLVILERYGTVHGTDAFRMHGIRPVPQMKIGVSVDSGVMDLSLTSQDLSQEELLAVLKSYRLRKRFHRLSSGDYVDLTQENQLGEVGDLLAGLDLSPEEVVEKSAKIPLYRALYLDKLLEEHDDIASSRDRIYRALIRNFRTVKDSEIEPPASLENVLRPYQQYGFKWLKTLENAGFGGILADEMGLGKTLQMIAVLLSDYKPDEAAESPADGSSAAKRAKSTKSAGVKDPKTERGESGTEKKEGADPVPPTLIVCPASLVYNWQEEFSKFAPVLSVQPIAGGAAAINKAWDLWDTTQVYIISYDLLKRHIAAVTQKQFHCVVLDEAQYIKNAGAAVSKSVKALQAAHRFALTGTPIENRLSELWSIFDFLMPGFLYSRTDFEKRLEVPITRQKDAAATARLRNMTSPFILRRKKEDVLKDLPEKLEEVRYVPITGEQQKLYDAQVLRIRKAIKDSDTTDENGKAEGSKVQVFAELTRIREICCDPSLVFENYHGESAKRTACLALIRQAMDGGHRMLVFSQFTSMLALLEKDLQDAGIPYYILTGATSKERRIQLVHDFNEGDTPVFLISLKAGGTGLNLTGADVVIHYDPWWNLAAQNQATDRTHRIGQTKQVTVYRIILKGTIEDRILELQESKKDLADSVLEGDSRSLSSLTSEELLQLLE